MPHAQPRAFHATARFETRRRIGEGALGVVYEAFDREHGALVALKALRTVNSDTLLSLKNEFRSVQGLYHPNLVRLGELFESQGTWFFTMELIRGSQFVEYVRDLSPGEAPESGLTATGATSRIGYDEAKLRNALGQLVDGLCALHSANKIHRDIKPSNVLVSSEGRVVVLDFSVTSDMLEESRYEGEVVGTAHYMAPEQIETTSIGPAADWYAVGVVLYEALTGQLPFSGTFEQIVLHKLSGEPPPPATLQPAIPDDLNQLCVELLHTAPEARPTGEALLKRLGVGHQPPSLSLKRNAAFVGRHSELVVLDEAFAETQQGRGMTVLVHGESGVGKSFLVRQFVDALHARDPRAVLLAGRCYERESVPYKAFDGIIDRLSKWLGELPEREVAPLLPASAGLLARAFPVLETLPTLGRRSSNVYEVLNPQELRVRMFACLRELLRRLAETRPLVIVIDDLQWTDSDSLALLTEVLRPPGAPKLLLVGTVRHTTEKRVIGALELFQIPGVLKNVTLSRLPTQEACELAEQLLAESGVSNASRDEIRAIVDDANGHPLFIDELVRQRRSSRTGVALRLDDALWNRIGRLDSAERRVLELLAVAGTPLVQETAAQAGALAFGQFFELVTHLRAEALVRVSGALRTDEIEPYHDRIRESVLANLDATVREQWHSRLALALERQANADPEAVALHWQGAGDGERAARYFELAAEQAVGTLAFERAARLFALALEACEHPAEQRRELRLRIADALTNAGRIAAAAELRLELAHSATPKLALELRRQAAEQLLCSGHFERGLKLVRDVLQSLGVFYPRSPVVLIFALLVVRVVLVLRGIRFRERDSKQIDERLLMRIDATWSASSGFSMSDNIRGAYFQTLNLLAALHAGDPHRVVRGLGFEVCFRSAGGEKTRVRTAQLLAAEKALAERLGTPEALALASAAEGYSHYMLAEWRPAKLALARAEELFRDQCVGVTFNLNSSRTMLYRVVANLGELKELERRVPPVVREAELHNDYFAVSNYQTGPMALLALARDQEDEVAQLLEAALPRLAKGAFLVQHYFAAMAECQLALYRGDAGAAHRRVEAIWPALSRSLLLRVQPICVVALEQRARCAIAAAKLRPAEAESLLKLAERAASRLEKQRLTWSNASARMLRAAAAAVRRDESRAADTFAEAGRLFDDAHMPLYAEGSRRARGLLIGGDEGAALIRHADERFKEQGVVNVARFAAILTAEVSGKTT